MRAWFGRLSVLTAVAIVMYIGLLFYPQPLFAHQMTHRNVTVHSDRAIPHAAMTVVLDDVLARLSQSELFYDERTFNVFLANDSWRFTLFTRNSMAGGVVNLGLNSDNVFIRACDIEANVIHPPAGWMYDADERPLSYFMAHEMTHALQTDIGGPRLFLTADHAAIEGYADYIGKAPKFDFERYRKMYLEDGFAKKSEQGLYHKQHMYMAILLDQRQMTYAQVLEQAPDLTQTLASLAEEQ